MKRVLLFLLLFSAGLVLLLYLSKEHRKEQKERLGAEQEQIAEQGLPFTEIPKGPGDRKPAGDDGAQNSGPTFVADGWLSLKVFEHKTGLLSYDFHADDVSHLGDDLYDITGITAHIYNPEAASAEAQVVRTTLRAERGRARIERVGTQITVGQTERVQLIDAIVTLHEGSPMAPIDLYLPVAEAELRTNSFYSDAEVRLEGDGVHGTGTGLIAEQDRQRLELQRNGYLQLVAEADTVVELFAGPTSPISFRRVAQGESLELLEVKLEHGGRLVAQGAEVVTVEGRALELTGRSVQLDLPDPTAPEGVTSKRGFLAEYAEVVGDAVLNRGADRVTGGVAEVRFDARGRVKRLQMSEEPEATGSLYLGGPETEPVEARIYGQGPMVLEYEEASPVARLELPGPATIEAPARDFRLDAAEKIEGSYWGRGLVQLSLHGAVSGRLEGLTFDGSEVDLRGSRVEEGAPRLFIETTQPAHLSGVDSKGKPVDVRAQKALQLETNGGQPRLVLARDVTFELVDEALWVVSVAELRDMDLEAGTFTADGDIEYSGPLGSGTATRAVGHSREHIELFGDEGRLATYDVYPDASSDLDVGLVQARHIDLEPTRARADDGVELRFESGGYHEEVDCEWFELRPVGETREEGPNEFEFEAREITRALLIGDGAESAVRADLVTGEGVFMRNAEVGTMIELQRLEASGNVEVEYTGPAGTFTARGERIEWRPDGGSRLEASVGERVEARGRFQEDGLPYVLTAAWIEYVDGELQALFPEISLDRPAALTQLLGGRASTELHAGSAEWMTADTEGLLLAGAAHFSGKTADGENIDLDAEQIHLRRTQEGDERSQGIEEMVAWGGYTLSVGDDLLGTGDVLQAGFEVLRMEGRPARLDVRGFVWESDNILYDVPQVLITTDQGRIFGAPGTGAEGWQVAYESLQPFENADSTMLVMRNPVMQQDAREVRANWAILWLDRDEWLSKTQEWLADTEPDSETVPSGPDLPEDEPQASAPTLFGNFDSRAISKVLKEVYLEGDIVYTTNDEQGATMDAAYVDLVDGHGWIQNCEIYADAKIGRLRSSLVVRAEWLRHSADGSLSADHAEVTACGFAEPHYFIRTKNLRLKPTDDGSSVWDVLLEDNALVFDNGLEVPLPSVNYKSDGKGRPTFSALSFGDSARYGTFVEASVNVGVGRKAAEAIAPLLGASPEEIGGNYRIKASYYGSRGLLLDQRFRLTAAEHFWMNVYLEGLYDTGEDRGMMRYKDPGSDGFRWVLYTPSRYILSDDEWFDLVFSTQSDPGVQAEFMETEFVDYERRDTYLRWRKADDENYYSAEVRVRADSFRNDVERLPDIGALHGLTPFAEVWGQPLLYTGSADVAYLRRREGTSTLVSPFDPTWDDSLGDREVLRADSRHRVEAPFELGVGGVRVSPYLGFDATTWSEGVDPATSPTRGAVIAGAEVQTTAFKTWSHGVVHSITPVIGYRGDLASYDDGGTPLTLDRVDLPVAGRFADVGLRSRWRVPGGARYLDISVRGTHADAMPEGEPETVQDGWQPVRTLGEVLAVYKGIPFAVVHDAEYDLDDGETPLSYTSLSLLMHQDIGVEVAYNRGLDDQRLRLYETVSLGVRWDATPKWQMEASQTVSRIDDSNLANDFLLRRVGHDFIFELSYSFRSGEGGNTLTFKYRPLLGWRAPTFGSMQALQRANF
jgi:hypothetical protein